MVHAREVSGLREREVLRYIRVVFARAAFGCVAAVFAEWHGVLQQAAAEVAEADLEAKAQQAVAQLKRATSRSEEGAAAAQILLQRELEEAAAARDGQQAKADGLWADLGTVRHRLDLAEAAAAEGVAALSAAEEEKATLRREVTRWQQMSEAEAAAARKQRAATFAWTLENMGRRSAAAEGATFLGALSFSLPVGFLCEKESSPPEVDSLVDG